MWPPYSLNSPPPPDLLILSAPHPVLRMVSAPVDFNQECAFLSEWAAVLSQMLNEHPSGVGLAAPKIGLPVRMLAMECSGRVDAPRVWINPVIKRSIGDKKSLEGCLSLPGKRYACRRAKRIEVEGWDITGKRDVVKYEGLAAICFQHELDHLEGILIEDDLRTADTA